MGYMAEYNSWRTAEGTEGSLMPHPSCLISTRKVEHVGHRKMQGLAVRTHAHTHENPQIVLDSPPKIN